MNSIAPTSSIKPTVILGDNITIGENVTIDDYCIIRDNVTIKDGSFVGAYSVIGEHLLDYYQDKTKKNHPTVIGENSIIRTHNVIYGDVCIGDNLQTGHHATIREEATIGNHVRLGTLSDIQGHCKIGNYVSIHSNVFVSQKTVIDDYAWIFSYVFFANDPTPPSNNEIGSHIESYAVISAKSTILPGITIGEHSLVGAQSLVTKNVPKGKVVMGNPAKISGDTKDIKNKITGENAYPWPEHFDRGMPWTLK